MSRGGQTSERQERHQRFFVAACALREVVSLFCAIFSRASHLAVVPDTEMRVTGIYLSLHIFCGFVCIRCTYDAWLCVRCRHR